MASRVHSSTGPVARRRARRVRPAPAGRLNRGRVLDEALALLDRDGPERFSVRRLAEQLGVTPMAVYNHVASKRDLLQGIADAVIERVKYPSPQGDWRTVVAGCFRTLRRACLAHPGVIPVIESADVLPTAVFRPMEITVGALQRAGFRSQDALHAYFLLTTFTIGQVSYQAKGWGRGVDPRSAVSDGRIVAPSFPALVQATARGPWDFDKAFEFGLWTILAGLKAQAAKRRLTR